MNTKSVEVHVVARFDVPIDTKIERDAMGQGCRLIMPNNSILSPLLGFDLNEGENAIIADNEFKDQGITCLDYPYDEDIPESIIWYNPE
jgi:hypothetical protein